MKKTLLLTALVAGMLSQVNAEVRKWDFTNWSATTKENVIADANWTNDEKGDSKTNVVPDYGCAWDKAASFAVGCSADSTLLANGQVITELIGLKFSAFASGYVAFGFDYQTTTDSNKWGPYNGPQYFWFANKKLRVIIPAVKPGSTITMGVESHKPSDARGVDLYIGSEKLAWTSGQTTYPTTYDTYTWEVSSDLTEDVDLIITPNNGCHVYYIEVDDHKSTDLASTKVGYIYQGNIDDDVIYNNVVMNFASTAIDAANTTIGQDSLLGFDMLVYAASLTSDNEFAKGLVAYDNMVPVLNLSASLYEAWGWGSVTKAQPAELTIPNEDDYELSLFADISSVEEGKVTVNESGDVMAYTAGDASFIAGDDVLATDGAGQSIHYHSADRNMYMLIPCSVDGITEDGMTLLNNAIPYVSATKKKASAAAVPVISQAPADGQTVVTINCATTASNVFYKIGDGAYVAYTEPFTVTTDGTVITAYATAHGYFESTTSEATVSVMNKAAAPHVSVAYAKGYSTIMMSTSVGTVYYSFDGIVSAENAAVYSDPVELKEPATLTAFVAGDGILQSEATVLDIMVSDIPMVKDTVSHFTANEEDWFNNAILVSASGDTLETPTTNWKKSAAYYYNKSAWSYYSTTEYDSTKTVQSSLGEDSIVYYWKKDPATVKYVYSSSNTDWRLRTQGQVLTGETDASPTIRISADPVVEKYCAETAFDLIGEPSKGKITFGGKKDGESFTGSIESTVKFKAPFDVVTYVSNGNRDGVGVVEVQTSADGENWALVDTINVSSVYRRFAKTRLHYAGDDEVYVRLAQVGGSTKPQVFDIYVITTEGTTGIENVYSDDAALAGSERIYDMMGRQVNAMAPGRIYVKGGKCVLVR